MDKRIIICVIFVNICLCFSACKSEKKGENNALLVDTLFIDESSGEQNYIVLPSAELVFDLQNLDIHFNPDLINSPYDYKNYQSLLSKSLNLGIYVTDFTYLVSIDNTILLKDYLITIRSLSNDLNIKDIYSEEMTDNYMRNLHHTDSLYVYILDTYNNLVTALQSSNRTPMLLTVSIGGLMELLYLISANIENVEDFNKMQSEMKNYNFLLDEYSNQARLYLSDPMVSKLMPDLENLYIMLNSESMHREKSIIKREGSNILIRKEGVHMLDYQHFMQIKDTVQSIRQKYITLK